MTATYRFAIPADPNMPAGRAKYSKTPLTAAQFRDLIFEEGFGEGEFVQDNNETFYLGGDAEPLVRLIPGEEIYSYDENATPSEQPDDQEIPESDAGEESQEDTDTYRMGEDEFSAIVADKVKEVVDPFLIEFQERADRMEALVKNLEPDHFAGIEKFISILSDQVTAKNATVLKNLTAFAAEMIDIHNTTPAGYNDEPFRIGSNKVDAKDSDGWNSHQLGQVCQLIALDYAMTRKNLHSANDALVTHMEMVADLNNTNGRLQNDLAEMKTKLDSALEHDANSGHRIGVIEQLRRDLVIANRARDVAENELATFGKFPDSDTFVVRINGNIYLTVDEKHGQLDTCHGILSENPAAVFDSVSNILKTFQANSSFFMSSKPHKIEILQMSLKHVVNVNSIYRNTSITFNTVKPVAHMPAAEIPETDAAPSPDEKSAKPVYASGVSFTFVDDEDDAPSNVVRLPAGNKSVSEYAEADDEGDDGLTEENDFSDVETGDADDTDYPEEDDSDLDDSELARSIIKPVVVHTPAPKTVIVNEDDYRPTARSKKLRL